MSPHGSGGFVVVWNSAGSGGDDTSDSSVQGQRYASDGSPIGGQFQVNTHTQFQQIYPEVSPDGAGGFVIVWQGSGSNGGDSSDSSIQAQRYAADGSRVGEEFQVNAYATSSQRFPRVREDGSGGFVVAWHSDGSFGDDSSDDSVQARRYAPLIFADGFESGDTSAWSSTVP